MLTLENVSVNYGAIEALMAVDDVERVRWDRDRRERAGKSDAGDHHGMLSRERGGHV